MSRDLTLEQVRRTLESSAFEELVGTPESSQLEFKGQPYQLELNSGKQELAKDVSALLNAGGGIIVVGIATEKHSTHRLDLAADLRQIPISSVDVQQYENVVRGWIYPTPRDVSVRWYRSDAGSDRGVLGILVPHQAPSKGPFLVIKSVVEEAIQGTVFGYFERSAAAVSPASPQEIQQLMREGRLLREILDHRAATADSSAAPLTAGSTWLENEPELTRAAQLVELVGFAESAAYVLTATPARPFDMTAMFESRRHPLVEALHHPPELRPMGFDLDTEAYPDIVEGTRRQSYTPGNKGLALWRDGILVFVAPGDNWFLCWGERAEDQPYVINPVPLVESALLFCRLAKTIYETSEPASAAVRYSLRLRRMCVEGKKPLLWPGEPRRFRFPSDARHAPDCEADVST